MSVAAAAAARLRRRHGQSGSCNVELMLACEGLILVDWEFDGEVRGLIYGKWLAIDRRIQDLRERRVFIAHMLAHYVLHFKGAFIEVIDVNPWRRLVERQAQEFAAHLLMTDGELAVCRDLVDDVRKLADRFYVPVWFAAIRLGIYRQGHPEQSGSGVA